MELLYVNCTISLLIGWIKFLHIGYHVFTLNFMHRGYQISTIGSDTVGWCSNGILKSFIFYLIR